MTRRFTSCLTSWSGGSSVFEGIRCYETASGPAVFRLSGTYPPHGRFGENSTEWIRSRSVASNWKKLTFSSVAVNQLRSCYVRPIVMRGFGEMGVNGTKNPIDVYLACWEWGKYLGESALAEGVDVCVSSWNRMAPNTLPALSKAGANYMNSQLMKMEAVANGYSEGIALDVSGFVSEGSGENIFLVRDGKIITPPLGASVLPGITRDTVLTLAGRLGIPVVETIVPRELLRTSPTRFSSRGPPRRSRPFGRSTVSRLVRDSADPLRRRFSANSSRSSMARSRTRLAGSRRFPCASRSGAKALLIPPAEKRNRTAVYA